MNLRDFFPNLQLDPPTIRYKKVMKQKTSQTEHIFVSLSTWGESLKKNIQLLFNHLLMTAYQKNFAIDF